MIKTVGELIDELSQYSENMPIVMKLQHGHELFAAIRDVFEDDEDNVLVLDFGNKTGYSPAQVSGK